MLLRAPSAGPRPGPPRTGPHRKRDSWDVERSFSSPRLSWPHSGRHWSSSTCSPPTTERSEAKSRSRCCLPRKQIPVGQTAETASANGSLELRTVAANSVAEGALSDIDPIADQVALTTIFPGQQIVSAAFGDISGVSAIPIPDDKMALSLQLGDPERVAGFLGAGSEVAVFVTLRNPSRPRPRRTRPRPSRPQLLIDRGCRSSPSATSSRSSRRPRRPTATRTPRRSRGPS